MPAEMVSDLMVSDLDPARSWQLLVRLLEIAETETDITNVSIGPLQSFLRSHGDAYVEQIANYARASQRFRDALQRTMPRGS